MQKCLVRLRHEHSGEAEWYHFNRSGGVWKLRFFRTGSTGRLEIFSEGQVGLADCPPIGFSLTHRVPIGDACDIAKQKDPGILNPSIETWQRIISALAVVQDQFSDSGTLVFGVTSPQVPPGTSELIGVSDGPDLEACLKIVHGLMAEIDRPQAHIKPTLLFGEGWMLRLCLCMAFSDVPCLPFSIEPQSRWYSEVSPPRPSLFKKEGPTWLDGVVGQCGIKPNTRRRLILNEGANQFIAIEAKMSADLGRGITHDIGYGQAARIVACMAETIRETIRQHGPFEKQPSTGLYIFAPHSAINKHLRSVNRDAVRASILERATRVCESPVGAKRWMDEWCDPLLDEITLSCASWQSIIDKAIAHDREIGGALQAFYARCEKYN